MKYVTANAKHNMFNIKEKMSVKISRYDNL